MTLSARCRQGAVAHAKTPTAHHTVDRNPELRRRYLGLAAALANESVELDAVAWNNEWRQIVIDVVEFIAAQDIDQDRVAEFLEWPGPELAAPPHGLPGHDNFYRYPFEAPEVQISVGSIHSVKGQTHTATLVLDTFYFNHHLQELKPWLLGQKIGKGGEGSRLQTRLKQHYVAMTRPTHLLCVAMKDTFTDAEIATLKARSWRVARVQEEDVVWL